ncbi:SDR family oxidoreductase [Streptomyces sp. AS02]|uniref:SDR family NAD(P)-dependent oxidoreductase n=1 Tax=Streptomyces sp. AS02 TaxID=2938946 RepID=UPI00202076D8|nr:SDR family NAD(P)-dependent oxidoreductase [Streptomyces sp. AS02]MCL8011272.1 SDR family NAD(P)-dependent oxidoreductase [Streptomyces sp. AS02]
MGKGTVLFTSKTAVILGAGPGLGMSVAHRFGREGYSIALVSRSDRRHPAYLASLAEAGIEAEAYVADVQNRDQLHAVLDLISARFVTIDVAYYGPAPAPDAAMPSITETDAAGVRAAMDGYLLPAVDMTSKVLPGMVERGAGALLFANGGNAVRPMPTFGPMAPVAAALRTYAVTLNAGLAGSGVYAGTLSIGGLIERSAMHQAVAATSDFPGNAELLSFDPDEIADCLWGLFFRRDRAEAVFNAAS